jgi:hypothetical protein
MRYQKASWLVPANHHVIGIADDHDLTVRPPLTPLMDP